ncbi:ABC transporter permease subunit [Aerococcaceae bacterium DSM 109653]|uniref:ABC transporter permease subunit n=1 Tax=Fundicoccus ignavus TaxID=2664442 RepID=A0A844C1L2_9LACT|nr:ABC transporter permease subunit [Fundicoccus ignavus]MRI82596.1 ABC transporter permease subunit [Fundicoccus ignavus]
MKNPNSFFTKLNNQKYLLMLMIPAVLITLIFKYFPMYGILLAFKDYNPMLGITGSEWVGLEHFRDFLSSPNFSRLLENTLKLAIYGLLWGFFPPIIIALMLNQIMSQKIKSTLQTILYMPNFISTVIIVGIIFLLFSSSGPIISILDSMGINVPNFLTNPDSFRPLYIFSGIWQGMGWASLLYTAVLSGVPPELYEAAEIDGATILQKIMHIELPTMKPLIIINLILSVGGIMNIGYEKAFLMQTSLNLPKSEIIDTYVYKVGLQSGDYSYSTAVGLFNTVINLILLLTTTLIVNRINNREGSAK